MNSYCVDNQGVHTSFLLALTICCILLFSQSARAELKSSQIGAANGTQCGIASWHEPRVGSHEARTAGKHPWINTEMIAAHRTLPLGTHVKVTNLANGRETVVEIRDRGPYQRGRIIDVSRKAALQLGLLRSGTARVRLERVSDDASS